MRPIRIGDTVGDYRVIDIVGAGGMGAVYKIEHVITKRIEAMKLLPPADSGDPEHVQRFEREIQVQARLHHPNIVTLYNAVREGSTIALIMEFVEGESLHHMLEHGALPIESAVDYAAQILSALAYAHDAGVIHRDVAPANIIVTPESVAKLSDFGLARGAHDLRLSVTGAPLGSPWYMSPEQVRGVRPLDPRTDIYAVGAVLHEMLTGRKLFSADGAFAVMRAHVESTPEPPSVRNPKVSAALDAIVMRALAKDPAERFQSAAEFHSALCTVAPVALPAPAPRRSRASFKFSLAPLLGRIPSFHPSRAAVLMALVPCALIAGIFTTIHFLPLSPTSAATPRTSSVRTQAVTTAPAPAPVAPAPPPVELQPQPVPPVTAVTPVVPAPMQPVAAAPVSKQPVVRPLVRPVGKKAPAKPPKEFAIRVTGMEPQQPEFRKNAPAQHRLAEAPEPSMTTPGATDVPPPIAPVVLGADPDSIAAAQSAALEKNQGKGNGFTKALGRVFKRKGKPADPAAKQVPPKN